MALLFLINLWPNLLCRRGWSGGIINWDPWIFKFNVWPHWGRALPLFDLRANLQGFVQPTGTPHDPYGSGREVQKPPGEIYDVQCDKRSEK